MDYEYLVLYSSRTGNTKRLATELFSILPGRNKDLRPIEEYRPDLSIGLLFVGFRTSHGCCSVDVMDLLSELHGQNVVLFGTCGMGNSPVYFREISEKVSVWLPDDNTLLGSFMCTGRMPIDIRRRYEQLYEKSEDKALIARLLHYYDEALLHPDESDFEHLREFLDEILAKQQSLLVSP